MTLSWHAVARADRYKIYRKIGEEKEKLVKTTTGLSYTGKLTDTEHTYRYRVKAVYDRNAEGNSKYSQAFYLYADLPLPTGLSGVLHDDENGSVTLSWNPVKGADCYDLYCCRSADGTYWLEATIEGKTTYFDSLRKPGQQYYYKIAARNSVTGARSQISSWYLI